MNKNIHITLFPVIISVVCTACFFIGVGMSDSSYKLPAICFAGTVCLFWMILYGVMQNKAAAKYEICGGRTDKVVIIAMLMLIAIFFVLKIWGRGYLSLAPVEKADNGLAHRDTLFHSSIAESYGRSLRCFLLVNDEPLLHYHTFSHLVMAVVSQILKIPAFLAYNYFYPLLFLPVYGLGQLLAVSAAKRYFCSSLTITVRDIILVAFYHIGFFPMYMMRHIFQISKSHQIISESFLTADTLAFLFFYLAFTVLYHREKGTMNGTVLKIFVLAVIPAGIFFISWSKISVGFLVTISILYFFFRSRIGEWKFILLDLYYGMVFLAAFVLFNDGFNGASGETIRFVFHQDLVPHCLLLSVIPILFLILEIKNIRKNGNSLFCMAKEGKTLWIELVAVTCLAAFIPEVFTTIMAGSYFSLFAEIPALILLCGHGYLDEIKIRIKYGQNIKDITKLYRLAVFYCALLVYSNRIMPPVGKSMISNRHITDIYQSAMELRQKVQGHQEDYTIYLEPDAEVVSNFEDSVSAVFLYPGLTGIGVINASYIDEDGKYRLMDGSEVYGFGLTLVTHGKLTYRQAVEHAQKMGKKYMIRIAEKGFFIEQLGKEQ